MRYETRKRKTCKTRRRGLPAAGGALAAWAMLALIFLTALFLPKRLGGVPGQPAPTPSPTLPPSPLDDAVTVRVQVVPGEVVSMPMSQYLWRVVCAEMPASFELEALKAQTVAARTYAVRKMAQVQAAHPDADVCSDINCCQAYRTEEEAAQLWGSGAEGYARKIARAVAETDGLLCLYEGQPIQALFHSSSAGRTLNAVEVWGNEVPYLTGVDSPEGEEVPNWHTETILTADEVREKLLAVWPDADLSGPPEGWLADLTYNSAGGVADLTVGGVPATGPALRAALGLRSANLTVEAAENSFTFTATGYGHGVGMSQYGANALAREGKDFRGILTWYYTGVEVSTYPAA